MMNVNGDIKRIMQVNIYFKIHFVLDILIWSFVDNNSMYYLARTNGYPMLSSMLFNVKLNVIQRYQYEAEMIFIVNLINQNTNLTY